MDLSEYCSFTPKFDSSFLDTLKISPAARAFYPNSGGPLRNTGGPCRNTGEVPWNPGEPYRNFGEPYCNFGGVYCNIGGPLRNFGGPSWNVGGPYCNFGGVYCNIGGPLRNQGKMKICKNITGSDLDVTKIRLSWQKSKHLRLQPILTAVHHEKW